MRAKPLARRPVRTFTVPGKSPPVPGAPPRPRCAPAFLVGGAGDGGAAAARPHLRERERGTGRRRGPGRALPR